MNGILDFYHRLAGKVREELPDLRTVLAVFDQRSWRDCRMALAQYVESEFGAAGETIAEDLRNPRAAGHTAAYKRPLSGDGGKTLTRVFMVNMDQARLCHPGDPVASAQGMVAHEFGHFVAKHRLNMYFAMPASREEGLTDLFNVAVMANEGHPAHVRDVLAYRLRSPFLPDTLYIAQADHPLPALADEAVALAGAYAKKRPGDFSVRGLKQEAERLVLEQARRIDLWQDFAKAAMTLAERGFKAAEVLALARQADSPFVSVVENFSGFRAAATAPLLSESNPFLSPGTGAERKLAEHHRSAFLRKADAAPPWFGYAVSNDQTIINDRRMCI